MSIVSYGILVYYPILWFHDHKDLDTLRYWYTALQALASAGCRDVMSWSNRTKTLKQGSNLEDVCAELTGIPTLEEIYVCTAASHYGQLLKMHKLGFLGPSVRLNKRTQRLAFTGNVQNGRISPFEPLFYSINNVIDPELTRLKPALKTDSALQQLEKDKNIAKNDVRVLQKVFSLACFGLLNTERSRKKFSAQELTLIDQNSEFIKTKVASVKNLCDSRKILKQCILKNPLPFTIDSKVKFGNKSNYVKKSKFREQQTF